MLELQPPNRTIYFMGPTCQLITHQATSWTQQLYKYQYTRVVAQTQHHPNPYTLLSKTIVTNAMKICPFCDPMEHSQHRYLHGDSIHLHVHCSSTHITQIHDQSNTDISTVLQHLETLFTNFPYPQNLGRDPLRTFLCHLLHQYDDNTQLNTAIPYQDLELHPYHHSTVVPRNHHNITTCPTIWKQLRPAMMPECSDYRSYSYGLESSLPPANYSRAFMPFIEHTYIEDLSRFAYATLHRYFNAFVHQQQRAHERYVHRPTTTPPILWEFTGMTPYPNRPLSAHFTA